MINITLILFLALNATTLEDKVSIVDTLVEEQTAHTFYYWARNPKEYIADGKGDCTDKALLKCALLRKMHIPCATVWGYMYNDPTLPHAFYVYKKNNTLISSEPTIIIRGNLLI